MNKEENKNYTCSRPWTSLIVNEKGELSFCCYHPPIANINELPECAFNETWNGKAAQQIRKRWSEGNLKGTPCGECEELQRFKKFDHPAKFIKNLYNEKNSFFENAKLNLKEFNEGKVFLKSMPVEMTYVPSILCNINCIHCFQAPSRQKGEFCLLNPDALIKFYNNFGARAIKNVFSGGESFLIKEVQKIIEKMSDEQKESSEVVMLTNAMLLKEKYDLIRGFRKKSFIISIDAFEQKRYEQIQQGANFGKLINALDFLNLKKQSRENIHMTLVMVLMKSNFIDLENVFDFAKTYKFDDIWIPPVGNLERRVFLSESIFKLPDLLKQVPFWKKILNNAIQKAKKYGYQTTYYHLIYIKKLLPESFLKSYFRSMRSSFFWRLKKLIETRPFFLVYKILKKILKIRFFRNLYKKFFS